MTALDSRRLTRIRWLVVALLLAGSVVWAVFRGLHHYGLSPAGIYYNVDQPPVLVFLVAVWFAVRVEVSRR